jgi:hypothetical protein
MPILALDLDGTLLEYQPGFDFEDHDALRRLEPVKALVQQARAWQDSGYGLEIITGRGLATRTVTEHQVESMLGPGVAVRMQASWTGPAALFEHKVRHLRAPGIVGFVGDGRIDQRAAGIVGIRFWWPDEFLRIAPGNSVANASGGASR